MSVIIVGGNECMAWQYKTLCEAYQCKAKAYLKMSGEMKRLGNPELFVLFMNTGSHKMTRCALSETKEQDVRIACSHSGIMAVLRGILDEHIGKEAEKCPRN